MLDGDFCKPTRHEINALPESPRNSSREAERMVQSKDEKNDSDGKEEALEVERSLEELRKKEES